MAKKRKPAKDWQPKPAKIYMYCTDQSHETPSKKCPKCKGQQFFRLK